MQQVRWRAPVVLVATLLAVGLGVRLGLWQLGRAEQKLSLQAEMDARAALPPLATGDLAGDAAGAQAQLHRQVRLRGRWLADHTLFLDNRQMQGRVGFYVVTPLLLSGRSDAVLVQRGWVARNPIDRTLLPAVTSAPGEVEIDGLIAPPPARLYEFSAAASGPIRQNLALDALAVETGLALRPFSVLQVDGAAPAEDGLQRHWPPPAVDVAKHYGYAFQWFALAALMAGLYVWFQLVPRLRRRA